MGRKKKRVAPPTDQAALGTSLGSLLQGSGFAASTPAPDTPDPPAKSPTRDALDLSSAGRLALRMERKGRGGKTVTVIDGVPAAQAKGVAKALKKHLGSAARIEGADIVVQGDLRERIASWLGAKGARDVRR